MQRYRHFASLDALRGLAAVCVAIPHYFLFVGVTSGTLEFVSIIAVEVFFVLSGFVLAPQLLQCIDSGFVNLKIFYARRWMRTLPPYAVLLVGMAIVSRNYFNKDFFYYLFFVRNLFSFSDKNDFFLVAWSLAIEEWFYLVFPVFLLTFSRFAIGPLKTAAIFILILFLIKIVVFLLYPDTFAVGRRVVVLRLDTIGFGFMLYCVLARARGVRWLSVLNPVLCLAFLATTYFSARSHYEFIFLYVAPLFAVSLLLMFIQIEKVFQRSSTLRAVSAFLASISYTIYLAHTLLIIILNKFGMSPIISFPIYLASLFAFCVGFYQLFEKPILASRPVYASEMKG